MSADTEAVMRAAASAAGKLERGGRDDLAAVLYALAAELGGSNRPMYTVASVPVTATERFSSPIPPHC